MYHCISSLTCPLVGFLSTTVFTLKEVLSFVFCCVKMLYAMNYVNSCQ